MNFSIIRRLLMTVASPAEFKAALAGADQPNFDVPPLWKTHELDVVTILHTGVGKANAAGAVARELSLNAGTYGGVLSIGLAGSYDPAIGLLSTVLGLKHIMLDEGTALKTDPPWKSIEEAGWATITVPADEGELHQICKTFVDHVVDVGTVSTISGTSLLMNEYLRRAPVKVETMESCAIAQVCFNLSIEYADVRIISNLCGERTQDNHDFPGSLKKMSEVVSEIVERI